MSQCNTTNQTQTCSCCGGRLPSRDVWELRRHDATEECTGGIDLQGRCHAFSDDALWVQTFRVCTDSMAGDYEATDADDAARQFASDDNIKGIRTAADLEAYLERVGGYGSMTDESGDDVFDVPS